MRENQDRPKNTHNWQLLHRKIIASTILAIHMRYFVAADRHLSSALNTTTRRSKSGMIPQKKTIELCG